MNWHAFVFGLVGLALLDAALTKRAGTSNVEGGLGAIVSLVQTIVDPTKPAFAAPGPTKQQLAAAAKAGTMVGHSDAAKAGTMVGHSPGPSGPGGITGPAGPT